MTMIRDLIGKELLIGDGAMGTLMQARGLDGGKYPALLNFSEAKAIEQIHRDYFEAGSNLVASNTFSANRFHLKETGKTVKEVVDQAMSIARNAAEKANTRYGRGFVAMNIAATGQLLEPYGDMEEDEAYDVFAEMITAGVAAGADLIFCETFSDANEIRIACQAAKDNCDLPIFASCSFEAGGRTFMGATPEMIVETLEEVGVDAVGLNCSLGPEQMLPLVKRFLEIAKVPVVVQPNAGLPVVENGKTIYKVTPEEFMIYMEQMLDAGVSIVGSCCGTTPDFIRAIRESAEKRGYAIARP